MQVPSGVANPGDEDWAKLSSISAARFGFFDTLFVGGQEAVCAQWRSNPLRPSPAHACAPLTFLMPVRTPRLTDFRTSLVQTVRDARAPRVQDRSGPWVDQGRRALAGLRHRLRRRGRPESRHLHVLIPASALL